MQFSELIRLSKSGDKGAMIDLYEKYKNLLYKLSAPYSTILKRNGYETEDRVQMCFIAFHNAVMAFDEEKGYSLTSLFDSCLKTVILRDTGIYKKPIVFASLDKKLDSEDPESITFGDLIQDENADAAFENIYTSFDNEIIHKAVDDLEEAERKAIIAIYLKDQSIPQYATESHISTEEARSHKERGLRELRKNRQLAELINPYSGTGLSTFKRTHTSSVEANVIRLDEMEKR